MDGFMGDADLAEPHSKFKDPYEMSLLKEKIYQFFKFKFDGSKRYIGEPMEDVHRNMGISDKLFDIAAGKMLTALKKSKPKMPVMREVIKRINGLKPSICFPPPQKKEAPAP